MERTFSAMVAMLTLFGISGCYSPNLKGTFKCNPDYMAPFDCPSGTVCSGGLCVRATLADAGVDKPMDASKPDMRVDMGVPPVDSGPVDTGVDTSAMCNMPVAACTADTSKVCDPTCQAGCTGCHQKCSVNSKGTPTCNDPVVGRPRALLEACNIALAGTAAQTDDCMPGLVCIPDNCSASGRCFQFCKADKDCPASTCSLDAGGGFKVCDIPQTTCNPVKAGMADGCGSTTDTLVCYVSATVTDRTFCDCPYPLGAGNPNSACTRSHDCFPGLACVANFCRQVCGVANGNADCPAPQTCLKLNGSAKIGYCNP